LLYLPLCLFVLVAVIIGLFVAYELNSGSRYTATIQQIIPNGASQVVVNLQVRNVGNSPGRPTCQVNMESSAGAFSGSATFQPSHPLSQGSSTTYEVLVNVTTGGAERVNFSASSVACN